MVGERVGGGGGVGRGYYGFGVGLWYSLVWVRFYFGI